MILEENHSFSENSFRYGNVICNLNEKNSFQYKTKSQNNIIKNFNKYQNISKLVNPIENINIIEQFSRLQLSDESFIEKNNHDKSGKNSSNKINKFLLNKEKRNKEYNKNSNKNNKSLKEKSLYCFDYIEKKETNNKNEKNELFPLDSLSERSPIRNNRSHCKVSVYDVSKKDSNQINQKYFGYNLSSPYSVPEFQLRDFENILNNQDKKLQSDTVNKYCNDLTFFENTTPLPGIDSFLNDQFLSSYFDLHEFAFIEETDANSNETRIHNDLKEIKTKKICEYLKSDKNYTEIPQLTNIIDQIESSTSDKQIPQFKNIIDQIESSSSDEQIPQLANIISPKQSSTYDEQELCKNYKDKIPVISIKNVTVPSTNLMLPNSPLQASSPPHISVSPDLSHNATVFTNFDSVKLNESQYIKYIAPISPSISISLGTYNFTVNNEKRTMPKERKLLPKMEINSAMKSQQKSAIPIINKSSKVNSMNKSVQEYLGEQIHPEVKRRIMKELFISKKHIEEIKKPIMDDGKTILHKFVIDQDVIKTYLLVERIKSYIKSLGGNLNEYIDVKDKNGYTPLFYAVKGNFKTLTAYLRECRANSCISDYEYGNTPYHIATIHGNDALTILRLLSLRTGDDVNISNKYGQTVLHFALIYREHQNGKRNELIRYLLKKNFKVCSQDNSGLTALHYAVKLCAKTNEFDILEILLNEGFDSKIAKLKQDKSGRSILHYAALQHQMPEKHQIQLIKLIMAHCPELLELKDNDGKLSYELVQSDRKEIEKTLQCKWNKAYGFTSI